MSDYDALDRKGNRWTRKDDYRLLELNRKIMWTPEEAEEAARLENMKSKKGDCYEVYGKAEGD